MLVESITRKKERKNWDLNKKTFSQKKKNTYFLLIDERKINSNFNSLWIQNQKEKSKRKKNQKSTKEQAISKNVY